MINRGTSFANGIATIYIQPPSRIYQPMAEAGKYVVVRIPLPDERTIKLRSTVKNEPIGRIYEAKTCLQKTRYIPSASTDAVMKKNSTTPWLWYY